MGVEEERFKASDFKYIGIEHNENLEEIFALLKFKINSNEIEISDIDEVSNFTKLYLTNKYGDIVEKEIIDGSIENAYENYHNSKSVTDFKEFNPLVIRYLTDVEAIISDRVEVHTKIVQLENEVENDFNLENSDLAILFSATQTAKYSYKYWNENMTNWLSLIKSDEKTNALLEEAQKAQSGCSWLQLTGSNSCLGQLISTVVMADVIGAVGAFVYALIFNIVPGGGQVAFGATIAGTAGASSTVAGGYWWLKYMND